MLGRLATLMLTCLVLLTVLTENSRSAEIRQRYCGQNLTTALSIVCRFDFEESSNTKTGTRTTREILRQKRGIEKDCCENYCTTAVLASYCKICWDARRL
uniref:Insulin-like domain-containing protein n=1 Tax=Cuerna arida TaxID=1464854 RepID=A0A1B6FX08_9HEMI